jgi:hypothetical protein
MSVAFVGQLVASAFPLLAKVPFPTTPVKALLCELAILITCSQILPLKSIIP